MDRRSFLYTSGVIGAATMVPFTACNMDKGSKYKMGLQLFSINEDMNKDPLGSLKAVKAMGYEDFEVFGFDPEQVTYYGYQAKEFKQILDDMELTATSGHYGFANFIDASSDDLKRFVDQCIAWAKALNSPYITWPWMAPEQRTIETFKKLPPILNQIGEQISAAGLGFAYHNHGFEFEDHNGEIGYDFILNETDPELVKIQMDMYWVMHSSKLTPKEWVAQQPGRFVMWHIKDMDKVTRDYTELGNGSIDYLNIMPDPEVAGLEYYYLEQGGNFAHSALQSAADSAEYFQKHLKHLL